MLRPFSSFLFAAGEGEKSGGPEPENGGEKQPPKSGQDPCECVGSLKAQSLKLDEALDSLISAMESLEEAASANKDPGLPRVSSTALAVVESLNGDVNKTAKGIAKYWGKFCRYLYHHYFAWRHSCHVLHRKKRDVDNEMDTTGPTGMEPTGPTSMGPETPVGMEPAGPLGMGAEGPPGMEPMPAGETGSPLCMAGDMAGILEDIAEEIEKGTALTEQAVSDAAISADAVSGIGEIIDALEEHKKTNKDVMKELDGLPCKD
ncbi:uncharacterized protein LOC135216679 [Macrobrachium nipponense]|uniref:uncharacterized protein LOC135216679 n=1 Tax=Macrobrachium nipponense TaxID=159736 RepID=UPI0030C7D3B3